VRAYESLRRKGDFQRLMRRGRKRAATAFVLFGVRRPADRPARVGITVAKTVGIAVARNRTRRRVKSVLDALGASALDTMDVLFVMRPGAAEIGYDVLADDIARALAAVR
jgi:ribonuclease P protein component